MSVVPTLMVQSGCPFVTRFVAFDDFLWEVVPGLFQAIAGVEVGLLGAVSDRCNIADAEVDTGGLIARSVGRCYFVFAHKVEFPTSFRVVVDGANLLQVLDRDIGARLVFDGDVVSGVIFVVRPFRESYPLGFGFVADTVLFPRHVLRGCSWWTRFP